MKTKGQHTRHLEPRLTDGQHWGKVAILVGSFYVPCRYSCLKTLFSFWAERECPRVEGKRVQRGLAGGQGVLVLSPFALWLCALMLLCSLPPSPASSLCTALASHSTHDSGWVPDPHTALPWVAHRLACRQMRFLEEAVEAGHPRGRAKPKGSCWGYCGSRRGSPARALLLLPEPRGGS